MRTFPPTDHHRTRSNSPRRERASGSEPSGSEPSGSEPSGSEPSGSEPLGRKPSRHEHIAIRPHQDPAPSGPSPISIPTHCDLCLGKEEHTAPLPCHVSHVTWPLALSASAEWIPRSHATSQSAATESIRIRSQLAHGARLLEARPDETGRRAHRAATAHHSYQAPCFRPQMRRVRPAGRQTQLLPLPTPQASGEANPAAPAPHPPG